MKDITLKIIGRQLFKDREEEQMEFVTDDCIFAMGQRMWFTKKAVFPECQAARPCSK